jgi:hypothetical protein
MVWPFYGVALLVVAANWILTWDNVPPDQPRYVWLVGTLAAPLSLPVWASMTFGLEQGARPGAIGWASAVLTVLALGCWLLAGFTMWRWRRRWFVAAPAVLAALVAAPLAWIVGAMAIVNDWM